MQKYILKGLCCAGCASKIEKLLKEQGYPSAVINMATSELILNEKEIDLEKITKIVTSIEPGVIVIPKQSEIKITNEIDYNELKKIVISSVFFILGIFSNYFGYSLSIQLLFFIVSYILVGQKVLKKTFQNIKRLDFFDENFLMSIATIGAFLIGEYPEGVAVMLFYSIGEFFQNIAVTRSRNSIKSLVSIKAEYANVLENGETIKVKPENVQIGQTIIIKPGEKVPIDGIVLNGKSSLDTSALTGESTPKSINRGEEVLSGMINLSGLLTVQTTKNFSDSAVSKILNLVESASINKTKTEKFITKFAKVYTPIIVFIAVLLAVVPPIIFNEPFVPWFYKALILLVISCPCALVLSIPLGYFAGIGRLAKEGILVKGSNYIDVLSKTTYVSFDKTGTLTEGKFKVTKIVSKNEFSGKRLLEIAKMVECNSNHPIAKTIMDFGTISCKTSLDDFEEFSEVLGKGIISKINGSEIIAGNEKLMEEKNINFEKLDVYETAVHFAVDGVYAGYILISDKLKKDSKETVLELKKLGIKKVSMLTGDKKDIAEKIASELNLDEYYSDLLPEDKVKIIEEIEANKSKKETIAFVGEGINDAPVIARADVGISMGTLGSDAAIETADVVIINDKPSKLIPAIKISKKTQNIAFQNIFVILIVKIAFISLGIFGETTMWQAVFADVGVALLSVLNAVRILK
ncbi:Cd2+/Zn2+-exporting ATPase [Methanococcus maripaludis]|uniref:Cd2+/Zn2+-exporting ATPase n=1 Tax=Methanococcus maripaludis TaxID=39152 RepID=A0A7J9P836_METMI|nr:heavy metal translocating P-type ATPase [Methanococcus maripaludis]MBA2858984.1 Cd2+/Zn2+-exporting ATPase [Methanococcus maripaludis]